jgi:hypothetical protein
MGRKLISSCCWRSKTGPATSGGRDELNLVPPSAAHGPEELHIDCIPCMLIMNYNYSKEEAPFQLGDQTIR